MKAIWYATTPPVTPPATIDGDGDEHLAGAEVPGGPEPRSPERAELAPVVGRRASCGRMTSPDGRSDSHGTRGHGEHAGGRAEGEHEELAAVEG